MTQFVPSTMLASDANNMGRLVNIVSFTASGSYTKNAASNYVIVHVIGGGGGAANTQGLASALPSGCGGAGGGYATKKIATAALGATEIVTIGAGGSGAAASTTATDGGAGGTSSFGAWCSATGGAGGLRLASGIGPNLGGIGAGGDINLRGDASPLLKPWGGAVSVDYHLPGGGKAAGPYAGAAAPGFWSNNTAQAGQNADANSGGGGGSGGVVYNTAASNSAGGNGGSGLVIIFEYA